MFNVKSDVDSDKDTGTKYTVTFDAVANGYPTSMDSACEFRALHPPKVQASELDVLALLMALFGVFLFLGRKK